jgi:hypothetical protein
MDAKVAISPEREIKWPRFTVCGTLAILEPDSVDKFNQYQIEVYWLN